MTWLAWAAGVGGLLALWRWSSRPAANDIHDPAFFARSLRLLLSRGVHKGSVRATLLVCPRGDKGRGLVYTKYIDADRGAGVEAEIASDGWVAPHYAALKSELDQRGIRYAESTGADGPRLRFDFGKDFGGAYMVARILYDDVLDLRLHRDCVVYWRDVVMENAPKLTGVDAPEEGWF